MSCSKCGRSGVKLWRPSHSTPKELLCSSHLQRYLYYTDQRRGPGVPPNIEISYVPAVIITGSEDSRGDPIFYSYTDIPLTIANTWNRLPE